MRRETGKLFPQRGLCRVIRRGASGRIGIQYFLESHSRGGTCDTEEQIRELAYAIWEQEGRPDGRDLEYYFRAKQKLKEREAVSSPAKDPLPPASALQPSSIPKPIERHTDKRRPRKT